MPLSAEKLHQLITAAKNDPELMEILQARLIQFENDRIEKAFENIEGSEQDKEDEPPKKHLHDAIRELRAEALDLDDTTTGHKYTEELNKILHEEAVENGEKAWQSFLFEFANLENTVRQLIRDGMYDVALATVQQDNSLDSLDHEHIIIYLKQEWENEQTESNGGDHPN